MSAVVIDASIALAWCFDDEATPETDALLDRVRRDGALVPSLWHLEIANVLLQAEKRARISFADLSLRLALLAQLPIAVDNDTPGRAWRDGLLIARTERLTSYDAAYLELALRKGAELATKDGDLADAARRAGVLLAI